MSRGHALLSPSASERWLQCPASVRALRDYPEGEESEYAREGTQFHTLCELTARHRLLGGSEEEYQRDYLEWSLETNEEWQQAQLEYVEEFIVLIQEHLSEDPDAILLLEQRVDTGVPGCWGTADVVIIYPDRLRVIDIKYGAGVWVNAVENSQLRLYGVGGLSLVEDPLPIQTVTIGVWQPRMDNFSEETLTRRELLKWRKDLLPIAELALGEDAPFGPSETACRWCPLAGECSARTRYMLAQDFGDPDKLTGEELAEAVSRVEELRHWASAVEDIALKRAYETAGSVPGYKVVRSGGRRGITDDQEAINRLGKAGFKLEEVSVRKTKTLGDLEKLVGKGDALQKVLGDVLVKSEGRLSLASESDPRPPADALHSAKTDFADITE